MCPVCLTNVCLSICSTGLLNMDPAPPVINILHILDSNRSLEEDFNKFTEYNNLNSTEIQQIANDRKLWRRIVRKCSAVDNDSAGSSHAE